LSVELLLVCGELLFQLFAEFHQLLFCCAELVLSGPIFSLELTSWSINSGLNQWSDLSSVHT
jgi:hypothetical protein